LQSAPEHRRRVAAPFLRSSARRRDGKRFGLAGRIDNSAQALYQSNSRACLLQ
jgi:hypothetical protein